MAQKSRGEELDRKELLANIRRLTIAPRQSRGRVEGQDLRSGREAAAQQHRRQAATAVEEYFEG